MEHGDDRNISIPMALNMNQTLCVLNISVYGSEKIEDYFHPHWQKFSPLTSTVHFTFGVIAMVMSVTSAIGNALVISLFIRFRSMRSPSSTLILNLSIADLIVSLATLPAVGIGSLAQKWVFGAVGCNVYGFLGSATSIASITNLTLIGMERCAVIAFSMKMSWRRSVMLITFTWAYGIIWGVIPLVGWGRYVIEGSQTSCTFDFLSQDTLTKSFVISLQVCVFHIPVSLLIFSYSSIFIKVRRHEKEMARLKKEHFLRSRRLDRETRIAKSALIITLVFCLAWLPYAVISIIGCFGDQNLVTPMASALPGFCAKLSTSINPILYALCHEKYRKKIGKDFRSVIRCILSCTKIQKTY